MMPAGLVVVVAATAALLGAAPARADEMPPLDFFAGDYAVVGRAPDNGAAYSGAAHIEVAGEMLTLHLTRGERAIDAVGAYEVPSPAGEGHVLRFRWKAPEPTTMTCLVGSDLDNYARLTCTWVPDGSQAVQPGLEAMFATGAWPAP